MGFGFRFSRLTNTNPDTPSPGQTVHGPGVVVVALPHARLVVVGGRAEVPHVVRVRPVDASRAHAAVRVVRAAGGADGRTPAGVVVVGEAGAAEAVDGHDVAVGVAAPDVDGA